MDVPQAIPPPLPGDDNGYRAWLHYRLEPDPGTREAYYAALATWSGDLSKVARKEWERGVAAICGREPQQVTEEPKVRFVRKEKQDSLGPEGYEITRAAGNILITSRTDAGQLYAVFGLLRKLGTGTPWDQWDCMCVPATPIRMLNHWDDPKFDHTLGPYNITRGFAGNSIFHWQDLAAPNPRYEDYARMLASIGINATCINNVNADPDVLESGFLPGLKAMADRLRAYNIRLFIAVPFNAPMVCGGQPGDEYYGEGYPFCMRHRKMRRGTLTTADPLEPSVQHWWKRKAAEIYRMIPDFGGYVIKANSEGMPGPQDYGRTHAEGANCLARSLAPHGGILFYRTFVYHWTHQNGPTEHATDACCQPFEQFKPLDGHFDDNVILQTKCGPADFRSHEPPNPLLGAVPQTRQAVEFMIAQEYLGQTTHACFQGYDWQGVLNFDTHLKGPGTTIAGVISGSCTGYPSGAIVGVANIGDDANWFGHLLAGANLYAFGRLAWEPQERASIIRDEWIRLTFGSSDKVHRTLCRILDASYDVYARYTVPLGMNYMFEANHHFNPRIGALKPKVWNRAGAGHQRGGPNGSGFLELYHPDARVAWQSPETTPLSQLLFFHFLPWDHVLPNGKTLSEHIRDDRIEAVDTVREWLAAWRKIKNDLDAQTWAHVYERLQRQYVHAGLWRDAGLRALEIVGQYSAVDHPQHADKEHHSKPLAPVQP